MAGGPLVEAQVKVLIVLFKVMDAIEGEPVQLDNFHQDINKYYIHLILKEELQTHAS